MAPSSLLLSPDSLSLSPDSTLPGSILSFQAADEVFHGLKRRTVRRTVAGHETREVEPSTLGALGTP